MPISDKTRLMAKRKTKEESDKIFNKNSGIIIETLVRFSRNMKNEKKSCNERTKDRLPI